MLEVKQGQRIYQVGQKVETLYLFDFRIDPDKEDQEIYTLFIYGEQERPLVADGYIVFFSRTELALSALTAVPAAMRYSSRN